MSMSSGLRASTPSGTLSTNTPAKNHGSSASRAVRPRANAA
ncbi:MAG: hypothetical protein PGN11_09260 [Quadrisphaera sp.]